MNTTNKLTSLFIKENYLNSIDDNIQVIIEGEQTFLNKDKISKTLYEYFYNTIYEVSIKQLLKWFHSSFDYIDETDKRYNINKFISFKPFYSTREFLILDKLIVKIIENKTNFAKEVISNFQKSYENIKSKYRLGESINLCIEDLIFEVGDLHNSNKSSCIIITNQKLKLVYKPRTAANDKFFYEIVNFLESHLNLVQTEYPSLIISEATFSIFPFIDKQELTDNAEAEEYYYRLGISTMVLYVVGATDIHFENIMSNKQFPIFIDLETLFDVTKIKIQKESNEFNSELLQSVLTSHIFDYSLNPNQTDIVGIGGYTTSVNLESEEKLINKGTDEMHLSFIQTKKDIFNVPRLANCFLEITEKKTQFIKGFYDAYNIILRHKNYLKKIIKDYSSSIILRTLIRPTYIYHNYRRKILEDLTIIHKNERLWKKFEQNSMVNKEIINLEKRALTRYDIPFFYCIMNGCSLYSEGARVEGFLPITPLEYYLNKLEKITTEDCLVQLWYLNQSIEIYNNYLFKKINTENKNDIKMYLERRIGAHLAEDVSFCSIKMCHNSDIVLSPMNYDLYDGLYGLKFMDKIFSERYNVHLIRDRNKIQNIIDKLSKINLANFSAYSGQFSQLKYNLLKFEICNSNIDFKNDWITYSRLVEKIDKLSTPNIDFLNGISGIISLMIELYHKTKDERIIIDIERISNFLWEEYQESPIQNSIISFAHGAIGIEYVFSKVVPLLSDNSKIKQKLIRHLDEKLTEIRNYIQHIIINETEINYTWCNGLTGFLVAWLAINKHLNCQFSELEKKLINKYIDNYTFKMLDDSICHGHAGNLLSLNYILDRNLNKGYRRGDLIDLKIQIERCLQNKIMYNKICSGYEYKDIKSFSLFLGDLGVYASYILSTEGISSSILY